MSSKIAERETSILGQQLENIEKGDTIFNSFEELIKSLEKGVLSRSLRRDIGCKAVIKKQKDKRENNKENQSNGTSAIGDDNQTDNSVKALSNESEAYKSEVEGEGEWEWEWECNFMIDAPVEVHLIAVLWLMFTGKKIQIKLKERGLLKHSYVYELNLCTVEKENGDEEESFASKHQLYKPYFYGYKKWQDDPIDEVKHVIDKGNDATIVSMDIRRFFYSVDIDVKTLVVEILGNEVDDTDITLSSLLNDIHSKYKEAVMNDQYAKCRDTETFEGKVERRFLPVGLLSSGLIANAYMSKFDDKVMKELRPAFYGRYVDDMVFVLKGCNRDDTMKVLSDAGIIEKEDNLYKLKGDWGKGEVRVNEDKVKVAFFKNTESLSLLTVFQKNMKHASSEFRFLPDYDDVFRDYDEKTYKLNYKDSVNKLQCVEGSRVDKYGLSKYLTKTIMVSKLTGVIDKQIKEKFEGLSKELLLIFQGKQAIELSALWGKMFTLFYIYGRRRDIQKLRKQIEKAVEMAPPVLGNDIRVLRVLTEARAAALCPEEVKDKEVKENAVAYRVSNMFNHNLVCTPCLNYSKGLVSGEGYLNLFKNHNNKVKERLIDVLLKLSPRFISLDELQVYEWLNGCSLSGVDMYKNQFPQEEKDRHEWKPKKHNGVEVLTIKDIGENSSDGKEDYGKKIRVAISNTTIKEGEFFAPLKNDKPTGDKKRFEAIVNMVNEAAKWNCNMIVMPEVYLPHEWLEYAAYLSKTKQIAIVTGVTIRKTGNNTAQNSIATILPYKDNGRKSSFVHVRCKKYYSPKEILNIEDLGYRVDTNESQDITIFHWRGVYFAVYYCFELASVEDRAKCKSKVDFVVAVEHNSDTNYFSDIIGSYSRDIHAYIVQVNDAAYGDSRVIKPSKTEIRNDIIVKGGKNDCILVTDMEIGELRRFQQHKNGNVVGLKDFKPLPPNFKPEGLMVRINDKDEFN
ncbi:MAG: hypothetical protein II951_07035 [Bacteroidales bacterium]|nr:hypothetical protein [Bacteroidales bacterium]